MEGMFWYGRCQGWTAMEDLDNTMKDDLRSFCFNSIIQLFTRAYIRHETALHKRFHIISLFELKKLNFFHFV